LKKLIFAMSLAALFAFVVLGRPVQSLAYSVHAASAVAHRFVQVCSFAPAGYAHCNAIRVLSASTFTSNDSNSIAGYHPSDLQSAYNLPSSTAGNGQTIALVDPYDDPNAESDLGVYRSQFNLPPCTTKNGCFKKVDQNGGTQYPTPNSAWAQETSLDLDMVSAICPNCNILLVEATNSSMQDLETSNDTTAQLGANVINNSYGISEYSAETTEESHYNHSGVAITASSGDNGYKTQFPASSQYVTAVGGTTLKPAQNARGWSETAWSGTGSGCSTYISKPSWQTDQGCSNRTIGDVSAVADPNTGVAAYDSFGVGGWVVYGGTSVASAIIAGIYGLAGNSGDVKYGSYSYSHTGSLNDVTSGSNGNCGSYLCTAEPGYDGPTGNGTPNGTGGF
jgi:subtilase family serine protease